MVWHDDWVWIGVECCADGARCFWIVDCACDFVVGCCVVWLHFVGGGVDAVVEVVDVVFVEYDLV